MDRTWVMARREARVEGWQDRTDLTEEQQNGITLYLRTGDKSGLPVEYAEKPSKHIVTQRKRRKAVERVVALEALLPQIGSTERVS